MKSTLMEYGLIVIALIILATFVFGVFSLFLDGGSIKEVLVDYVSEIC